MGYGSGWGMMGGWGSMGGFGVIFWLVILAIIIAAVVWYVRSLPPANNRQPFVERSAGVLSENHIRTY
jgi:uncharacterized membrane protein